MADIMAGNIKKIGENPIYIYIPYILLCVIYIAYKYESDDAKPNDDGYEKWRLIPAYANRPQIEKQIYSLISLIVTGGIGAVAAFAEGWGVIPLCVIQIIFIWTYITAYIEVNTYWGDDSKEWDTDGVLGPSNSWFWLVWGSFVNVIAIILALGYKLKFINWDIKFDNLENIKKLWPLLVLFVVWFTPYISVGPSSWLKEKRDWRAGGEGVLIKETTQITDYFWFLFSIICVAGMGYFGTQGKTQTIGIIVAVWYLTTLLRLKFKDKEDTLNTDEYEPYDLSMLTDEYELDFDLSLQGPTEVTHIDYANWWLPISNKYQNFPGFLYLLFYIAVVLVPTFLTSFPNNLLYLFASSILIPLFTWLGNRAISSNLATTETKFISSFDVYSNFIKGTHKDWTEGTHAMDIIRLLIRLVLFIFIYLGPLFLSYKKLPRPFNYAGILVWILVFPVFLSKFISHDCILSGDTTLEKIEKDKDMEETYVFHQHGGGITILTLIIIGVIKILV